jgi:MFS family permease
MGGFFALAGTSSINDIFFVHQRGLRVGLWNFAVIVSVNIAPIISGYVIVDLSWRWSFGLLSIFFAVVFLCVVFLFSETAFERHSQPPPSVVSITSGIESHGDGVVHVGEKGLTDELTSKSDHGVGSASEQRSLWNGMMGLNGFKIQDQSRLLILLVEPFLLLRHPVVIWGCCMWAVTFTWVIIQGAVAAQIFTPPPYSLSPTAVGNLIGIAPLIGSALGTFLGGWSCDVIAKLMARKNNGMYEPEFRLVIIIPSLIAVAIGGFGLGVAVEKGLNVVVCGVFLAFINFAVGMACTGIVAYTNDVCQDKAGDSFGLAMVSPFHTLNSSPRSLQKSHTGRTFTSQRLL